MPFVKAVQIIISTYRGTCIQWPNHWATFWSWDFLVSACMFSGWRMRALLHHLQCKVEHNWCVKWVLYAVCFMKPVLVRHSLTILYSRYLSSAIMVWSRAAATEIHLTFFKLSITLGSCRYNKSFFAITDKLYTYVHWIYLVYNL